MAAQTAIEWTDATWNPVSGCTKLSGCDNCFVAFAISAAPWQQYPQMAVG
jgi:protein gp37